MYDRPSAPIPGQEPDYGGEQDGNAGGALVYSGDNNLSYGWVNDT